MRMKIGNSLLAISALAIFGGLTAKADGVVGGVWQAWNPSILASPGTGAYWNNQDPGDAGGMGNANIGFCLNGGGNCTISNPPGNIPFLSSGVGGAAPVGGFYLTNSGIPDTSELLISITNNQANDQFGWYTVSGGAPVQHSLFNGTQDGTTMVFTPTSNYGFYLVNSVGTFYTQTTYDSLADNFEAFALFQQTAGSSYYLGVEDDGAKGDRDYNDMVIHLSSVPEPTSMALLGGSLLLMGAFIRRRNRNSAGK